MWTLSEWVRWVWRLHKRVGRDIGEVNYSCQKPKIWRMTGDSNGYGFCHCMKRNERSRSRLETRLLEVRCNSSRKKKSYHPVDCERLESQLVCLLNIWIFFDIPLACPMILVYHRRKKSHPQFLVYWRPPLIHDVIRRTQDATENLILIPSIARPVICAHHP